jgi:hypothetical protein
MCAKRDLTGTQQMMPYRLAIRMVPGSLWHVNLRKGRFIPQSGWEKIKIEAFDQRGLACQTCGKVEIERSASTFMRNGSI